MKVRVFYAIVFLLSSAFLASSILAQNIQVNPKAKKSEAQLPTACPVPGASVKVFLVPQIPIKECITDGNGEFSVTWDEINAKLLQSRAGSLSSHQVNLLFEVTPPQGFQYLIETNTTSLKIAKSEHQKSTIRFVLRFKKSDSKTNKGAFIINPKMDSG